MTSAPKSLNRTHEEESLESVVGHLLRRQGKTLATAESCTGGYLGKLLTDIPGSSDFYQGGIISYSNALKIRHLKVSPAALDRWGAVSEPVACQMARGVPELERRRSGRFGDRDRRPLRGKSRKARGPGLSGPFRFRGDPGPKTHAGGRSRGDPVGHMPYRPGLDPKAFGVIRAFIAIEVPPEVKNHLSSVSATLGSLDPDARLAPVSNLHLTLRFLGNIEESRVSGLGDAIRRCARQVRPFSLAVRNLGAFPSRKRPRVVWTGVSGDGDLERLHHLLEVELQQQGIEREKKRFRPHMTLLRVKTSRNLKRLSGFLDQEEKRTSPVSFRVRRIHLFESRLHSRGARHRKLVTAELGS